MKRRTRRIVIAFVLIGAAIAAYFYGSQITKIEIAQVEASERNDGLLQKLISREEPSLRALVIIDGRKIYSEIKTIDQLNDGEPLTVELDEAISIKNVSMLELHDARFSAAAEIIVLGQVLETFEQPKDKDQGKRFAYKFKSRWGF